MSIASKRKEALFIIIKIQLFCFNYTIIKYQNFKTIVKFKIFLYDERELRQIYSELKILLVSRKKE